MLLLHALYVPWILDFEGKPYIVGYSDRNLKTGKSWTCKMTLEMLMVREFSQRKEIVQFTILNGYFFSQFFLNQLFWAM